MLHRIRTKLTYANVMATMAMFFVLTGVTVAFALPRNSVGPRQLKKEAVKKRAIRKGAVTSTRIRKNAVNARKIRRGAVRRSEIAKGGVGRSEIARGAVGTGEISNRAVTRSKIADSVIPLLGTLRSGQELRGSFNLGGDAVVGGEAAHDGYNFQFPLTNTPIAPAANVINVEAGQPATAACGGLSGGNNQTPLAAPGHLCVYITATTNIAAVNPVVLENVNRLGFGLAATSLAGGNFVATGFWAVTAP